MSGAIGIEQVGQLVRCALLIADWVVPGVWSVCEMCGVEKVVVTIHLGFAVDRHDASFQYHKPPNKRLAVSSGEREVVPLSGAALREHGRANREVLRGKRQWSLGQKVACSSPATRYRLSRIGPGD